MAVAAANVQPRFPQAPFPLTNGTAAATSRTTSQTTLSTSRQIPPATRSGETQQGSQASRVPQASQLAQASAASTSAQTPTFIPKASYVPITVAPIGAQPPATTSQSSIPAYGGSNSPILKGYCTEPAYTILDGPTALWIPVIGCVSSKTDCCPQPTKIQEAVPAQSSGSTTAKPVNGIGQFPIGALPDQGEIKGCPKDYHTVTSNGGTACCPTSYWLWSTQIGGQTPCYSSLDKALLPPPIPETLASTFGALTRPGGGGSSSTTTTNKVPMLISGTMTPAPMPVASDFDPPKPTSAIVNIAYAMQYKLAAENESQRVLAQQTKIGIGVGAAAGAVLVLGVVAFAVRRWACGGRKRTKNGGFEKVGGRDGVEGGFREVETAYVRPQVRVEEGIEPVGGTAVPLMMGKDAGASVRPVEYRD